MTIADETSTDRSDRPLRDVVGVMAKLGFIAFGGPAVHVAMLRDETVRRRHWISDEEFLDLFGAVSVLPGPSSTQLAIALSRRRAGWRGLVIGGICFIAPAVAIVLTLAWLYVQYGTTPTGTAVLYGVGPVVVAVVAVALRDLAKTAFKRRWLAILAAGAVAAYFVGVNILLVLLLSGLISSLVTNRRRLPLTPSVVVPFFAMLSLAPTGIARSSKQAMNNPTLAEVFGEFLKLGTIVFGSGYVLLAFLRTDLVQHFGWLTDQQVLDAVSVGQVTPGPVFTTATFIGYLLAGVPGALLATVGIFIPSFFMVAVVERVVPRLRRSPWTGAALDGIAAAALGLMAGVTIDLGRAAINGWYTALLAVAALAVLVRWRPNAAWIVFGGAVFGVVHQLL
jgi:chromate transporter